MKNAFSLNDGSWPKYEWEPRSTLGLGGLVHKRAPGRRRVRSRSSPVRLPPPQPTVSARSPSESLAPDSPRPPFHILQHCADRVGGGSAWFSARPPAAPMRLVSVPPPVPLATLHCVPRTLPLLLPPPPQVDSQISGVEASGTHVARSLLAELMACLPLATTRASACDALKESNNMQSEDSRDHIGHRHNIAVQAHFKYEPPNKLEERINSETECSEGPCAGEEWLGGVRALRDSHVRLVLRQLRHIEKLNRALDRAIHH